MNWLVGQRKTSIMISLLCGIENMTQMNLFIKQKQTHRHRKQADGYQRGKEPGKTN